MPDFDKIGCLFDWPGQPVFDPPNVPAPLPPFTATPLRGNPSQYAIPGVGFIVSRQGDTWDTLSWRAFGSEFFTNLLADNNPIFNQVSIFDGGILLNVPIVQQTTPLNLPPWKTGATLVNA
jgi:hypothetical protein